MLSPINQDQAVQSILSLMKLIVKVLLSHTVLTKSIAAILFAEKL